MTSLKEVSGLVNKIEEELDLFDIKVDNIPIWWFIRDKLITYLFQKESNLVITGGVSSLKPWEKISKIVDSVHLNLFKQHDILAVSTSSARRCKKQGKDQDIYMDFLSLTKYKNRYSVIETPDTQNHSKIPYSDFRYYGDMLVIAGNISRKIPLLNKKTARIAENISDVITIMLRKYHFDIEKRFIYEIIRSEIAFAKSASKVASIYIDKIKPKILFVECGYSPSHMAIQYEAKKKGIPVIEIQHGLIIPSSMGYCMGIKDETYLKDSPFPDLILVYGEHFKNVLLSDNIINESKIKVIGNPFLWQLGYDSSTKSNEKKIIIATGRELNKVYFNIAKELARKIDMKIVIKPHPSEVNTSDNIYHELKKYNNIEVIETNILIEDLFERESYHISANSFTHLEAISFGMKDIIIQRDEFNDYYNFLKELGVPFVTNTEELVDVILNYPCIDRAFQYVINEVFAIEVDPIKEIEKIIDGYI